MMNKNNWTGFVVVMAVCLLTACSAYAGVKVTNVEVKPRWPWNGLVDIFYCVFCDEKDINPYEVRMTFEGYDAVLDKKIIMKTMTGDGVGSPVMSGGPYKATWNASEDYPTINSARFQVKIHATVPLYMVVDLSGGYDAKVYPVRYTCEPPDLNSNVCRTTELWLRRVSAGKFLMGSETSEENRDPNEIQHEVSISKTYYIGVFECTQKQYQLVMGGNPTWEYHIGDCRPVDNVSYSTIRGDEAIGNQTFIGRLQRRTGLRFDLPTEAQWEFAARGGVESKDFLYSGSNIYDNIAVKISETYDVGLKQPNELGLYDMTGNVWEWCQDWFKEDYYTTDAVVDPMGPRTGSERVARGGSYWDCPVRLAARGHDLPECSYTHRNPYGYPQGSRSYDRGFRVACFPQVP